MWQHLQYKGWSGLLKFFRTKILTFSESDLLKLSKDYENDIKRIKDDRYRVGWYMRGSLTYKDLMYHITNDDMEIFNNIIKDNIDATEKTKMPLI